MGCCRARSLARRLVSAVDAGEDESHTGRWIGCIADLIMKIVRVLCGGFGPGPWCSLCDRVLLPLPVVLSLSLTPM